MCLFGNVTSLVLDDVTVSPWDGLRRRFSSLGRPDSNFRAWDGPRQKFSSFGRDQTAIFKLGTAIDFRAWDGPRRRHGDFELKRHWMSNFKLQPVRDAKHFRTKVFFYFLCLFFVCRARVFFFVVAISPIYYCMRSIS